MIPFAPKHSARTAIIQIRPLHDPPFSCSSTDMVHFDLPLHVHTNLLTK